MEARERRDRLFIRLHQNALKNVWLIRQLARRGITTSASEMTSVMSGARTGPKAALILDTAEAILDDYEKDWA